MFNRDSLICSSWVAFSLILATSLAHAGKSEAKHDKKKPSNSSSSKSSDRIWSYEGDNGPIHWGDLKTSYGMCKYGRNQSPINIKGVTSSSKSQLEFFYRPARLNIENNGHTIKVNYSNGSYVRIGQKKFKLVNFQFHSPSEHTIDGKVYPLEAQLVHKSKDGQYAFVSVFMEEGKIENEMIETFWRHLPNHQIKARLYKNIVVHAQNLLPDQKKFYRYRGSLTTPPCSEGVIWSVMNQTIKVSKNQIQKFQKIFSSNARPVQTTNGRSIASN